MDREPTRGKIQAARRGRPGTYQVLVFAFDLYVCSCTRTGQLGWSMRSKWVGSSWKKSQAGRRSERNKDGESEGVETWRKTVADGQNGGKKNKNC